MGCFGVIIDWIKPFFFLLDSKVMEQVNNPPEDERRREIPPPQSLARRLPVPSNQRLPCSVNNGMQ